MKRISLLTATVFLVSACGGGGSDSGGSGSAASNAGNSQFNGRFVDSPVAGVTYRSDEGSGITAANGGYSAAGDIRFLVGDIDLGNAPANAFVTPVDLVPGAAGESDPAANAAVTNIVRLLQTLDADARAANGIQITQAARDAGASRSLTFNQGVDAFANDPAVQAFLEAALGEPTALIGTQQAREHLRETLEHIAEFGAPNRLPTAEAGADQAANSGDEVLLDGSASSDSDTQNADSPITAFAWRQVSGPMVTLENGDSAAQRRFTPQVAGDSVLVFELTVTDDDGGEHSDQTVVVVQAVGDSGGNDNQAPVAQDSSLELFQGLSTTGRVNASDADGDNLELSVVDSPAHGDLQFAADGRFSYRADADFNGTDAFTFVADDGAQESNVGTVTIRINTVPEGRILGGAAKRSVTPLQEHIDGVAEERFAGAPHLQKFNLGGFGIDPLQNFPDPVGGFGDQITEPAGDRRYRSDETWVRTLVIQRRNLDGSDTQVAFITLDAVGAGNIIQAGLKAAVNQATGIPESNILFGQTHSHAGADLQGLWGGVPQSWINNPEDGNGLYQLAANSAREAMNNLRIANLSVSTEELPQFNSYRRPQRDPDADADATATLLRVRAADNNEIIGSLMQYNAHPTTIGTDDHEGVDELAGRVAHPDYIVGVTEDLETQGGIALFFNGPIADASSSSGGATAGENPYESARNRGVALSSAARANESGARVLTNDIAVRHAEVILPVTNPLFLTAGALGSFNRYYDFAELPFSQIPGIGPFAASQASNLPQATPTARTLVSRITLGSGDDALEIITIPGEATNTFGEYIQTLAGKQTMLLGLTQNSFGYILPEEEFNYASETGDTGLAVIPFTNYEEFVSLGPLTAPLLRIQGYNPLFDAPPEANAPPALAACFGIETGDRCFFEDVAERPDFIQSEYAEACRENGFPEEFCGLIDPGALTALAQQCRANGGPDELCNALESAQPPSGGGVGGDFDLTLIPAALEASLRGCDILDPAHCMMPFPSNHFTTAATPGTIQSAEAGGTGRRVNFNILGMPRNIAGKPVNPIEWNRNDGFSPGQMITTVVPGLAFDEQTGAVAGAPPITNIQESLFNNNASVMVIDVDTGARQLVWAEMDLNAGFFLPSDGTEDPTPEPPALMIRPAKNFEEGHRYIVVLRNMRDSADALIPANPAFAACRDQIDNPLPQVSQRCAQLETDVFAPLAAASAANPLVDVARDDSLFLAWDFTVSSQKSLTARLLHMRDDAFGSLEGGAPPFTVDEVVDNPNDLVARRVQGTLTVPSYLVLPDATPVDTAALEGLIGQIEDNAPDALGTVFDGIDLVSGANLPPNRLFYNPADGGTATNPPFGDGLPDRTGDLTVDYTCNVPRAAITPAGAGDLTLNQPSRPSLYGHGLLGSGTEVNNTDHVASMGDAHNVMYCAIDWYGFASVDVPNVLTTLIDLSLFPLVPDGSQQGILNFMFLARLLNHDQGFAAHEAFQVNGQPVFDRREVFYDGNSQGGILGGVVLAASPDVHRGVLGVPGMNYSTLLRRSVDFDVFSIPLYLSYQSTLDRTFLFSFMEMVWERSENNGYAAHLNKDPLPSLDGEPLPVKRALLHPAYADHQVTMWSADVMARTMLAAADGSRTDRHPDQVPFDFLDPIESEYAFDAVTQSRRFDGSALVIWDEPWNTLVDDRCEGNVTPVPPVGNIPPRLGDDPHECPRREVAAQCQKSHFMHSEGAVIDVSEVQVRADCPALPALGDAPPLPDGPPDEDDDSDASGNPLAFLTDRLDPAILSQAGETLAQCQLDDTAPNCLFNVVLDTLAPADAVAAVNGLVEECANTPAAEICAGIGGSFDLPDRLPFISELVQRGELIRNPAPDNPQSRDPAGNLADWAGESVRIAGTEYFDTGEHIYTDYVFDAYGADNGDDARRLAIFDQLGALNSRLVRLEQLFQAAGAQFGAPAPAGAPDHYGDATDLADEADMHDVRWAAAGDRLLLRVQTTAMTTPDTLGLLVLVDSQADDGDSRPVGFGTNLSTEQFDTALLITADGVMACDLNDCAPEPLEDANLVFAPGDADDDPYRNTVQVSLPASLLAPSGSLKVAVVAGPRTNDGITPANVAYRFDERVAGAYQEQGQALALFNGNVDAYTAEIAVADLLAGRSETARPGPGYHERQFLSGANISTEGGENGRLQHYGLFVPASYAPSADAVPLTFWLHYRGGKAHVGASYTPRLISQLGEEQNNIVVTPRGRGTSTWYVTEAHQDFFEVYADTHALFANIDPARRYLSGYSMGGYGTYLFGLLYPDLFAAGYSTSGAPTQGAWSGIGPDNALCENLAQACYIQQANGGDADAQLTWRILDNARHLPLVIHHGSNDELVPVTGIARYATRLAELGYRHQSQTFAGYEHFTQAIIDEWADGAEYLNQYRLPENPRQITYKLVPALVNAVNTVTADGVAYDFNPDGAWWVDSLSTRDGDPASAATAGRIEARSRALAAPQITTAPITNQGLSPGNHSTPFVATGVQWLETGQAQIANDFFVGLTNLATATLDVTRMALDTGEAVIGRSSSDGPTTLTLANIPSLVTVYLDREPVAEAGPGMPAVLEIPAGSTDIHLLPPGASLPPPEQASPFAACQEDPSDPSCVLSALSGLLSPTKLIACGINLTGDNCPLSALAEPLIANDPTGIAEALATAASKVNGCLQGADPVICQQSLLDAIGATAVAAGLPLSTDETRCDAPAGDPDPVNEQLAWQTRDLVNILCSTQRLTDMNTNPAFGQQFVQVAPGTLAENIEGVLAEPARPVVSLGQLVPGARAADPFRVPGTWEAAGRGRTQTVSFIASDGALLQGRLFMPNSDVPAPYAGVVITTGSIQAYKETYYWAAEGLAEAGYMVLIYDVQGQGQSEVFPHRPNGDIACDQNGCQGVPFQQDYNFFQGARDAHAFMLSNPGSPYGDAVSAADQDNPNAAGSNAFNPAWAELDRRRIGAAGQSLGASAVSVVGQELACDPDLAFEQRDGCVSAIVGWDALAQIGENAAGEPVVALRAPALSMSADYFLNPEPAFANDPPNPGEGLAAFQQLRDAGVDSMRLAQRSSTHLEWVYVPLVLPASRYGERVAMHYSLAWFDRYLRNDDGALQRLTATRFDASADASSIGAGTYDVSTNSNVPYKIEGDCVADRLSIYYRSAYFLEGGALSAADLRARGCIAQ